MCSFVGLGEDPQVLAIRAPELFGVRCHFSNLTTFLANAFYSLLPLPILKLCKGFSVYKIYVLGFKYLLDSCTIHRYTLPEWHICFFCKNTHESDRAWTLRGSNSRPFACRWECKANALPLCQVPIPDVEIVTPQWVSTASGVGADGIDRDGERRLGVGAGGGNVQVGSGSSLNCYRASSSLSASVSFTHPLLPSSPFLPFYLQV